MLTVGKSIQLKWVKINTFKNTESSPSVDKNPIDTFLPKLQCVWCGVVGGRGHLNPLDWHTYAMNNCMVVFFCAGV